MRFDHARWQRARPLFDELVDLDEESRGSRLEAIRREDPAMGHALDTLLLADGRAEEVLREYSFGLPRRPPTVPDSGTYDPLGIIGRTVSHFRVTGYLASGGMGVVYTADDQRLGREVALKFPLPHQHLDESVKQRFVHEARSAAGLDHPNLCTVYEVGESAYGVFLAMPRYPGETLKERLARERRLSPGAALGIVRQVTMGLVYAHAAGIVHRDLKPGNIMLLPDDSVKILDFGLAKVRDVNLTTSRMPLGTIGYMAPDQIGGARADERADLWSIGVMLYEMLTGVRPFRGDHELSILHAILHEEAPPPSSLRRGLPAVLDALIDALLQKNPVHRYPSARALLADLAAVERGAVPSHRMPFWTRSGRRRKIRRAMVPAAAVAALLTTISLTWSLSQRGTIPDPTAARAPTVAVLPFANSGGELAHEYRVSGITDALITLLERGSVGVVPRTAAAALQRRGLAPRSVGQQLGVAHLVEGMARVVAETLQVEVRLTRLADNALLWRHQFRAPGTEQLALERELADSVLAHLRLRPTHVVARRQLPTSDPEAYDLYLRGRYLWNQAPRTKEILEQSLVYYRHALERDHEFAVAHSGTAMAYVNMANFGYMPLQTALGRADRAVERALALDSSLADGHAARGFILAARGALGDAEASLRRAIALDPNHVWAHHFYSLVLTMNGRIDEAIGETRRGLAIDPLSLPANTMLGILSATEGKLLEANAQLRRALELAPGFPLTQYYLGAVEAALGNDDAAREVLEGALATAPDFPGVRAVLARTYRRLGRAEDADRLVAEARAAIVDERTRVNYALALALLGPADSAFAMLRTAQWDIPTLIVLRSDPLLSGFRSDPRYPELLARSSLKP